MGQGPLSPGAVTQQGRGQTSPEAGSVLGGTGAGGTALGLGLSLPTGHRDPQPHTMSLLSVPTGKWWQEGGGSIAPMELVINGIPAWLLIAEPYSHRDGWQGGGMVGGQ